MRLGIGNMSFEYCAVNMAVINFNFCSSEEPQMVLPKYIFSFVRGAIEFFSIKVIDHFALGILLGS